MVVGVLVVAGIAVSAGPVHSQVSQVVTVCGRDDAGGGLNLATALANGGTITIRCPPGVQEIQITRTHALTTDVAVTGDGEVVLKGPGTMPMFTTSRSLKLAGLVATNPAMVTGSIVAGDQADVSLTSVVVHHSPAAFLARTLRADASRFADNGDYGADASGNAVINAETVELTDSDFTGNGDHPIAGGAWPTPDRTPLARSIMIDKSRFTENRSPLLLVDAEVVVRESSFTDNGRGPDAARDTWGCCGGAITLVRADAEIIDSDFRANGSSGAGGAIHAVASRLRVASSSFDQNVARVGGAIMSWARLPRNNIWSTDTWTDLPGLALSRVTFTGNKADVHGGAIAFAGTVQGEGLVVRANESGSAGGAIASWRAAALPEPYGGVFDALESVSQARPSDTLSLTRTAVMDNRAGQTGSIVATADAEASLGNVVIARSATGGATVVGNRLRVVNSVIADNTADGVRADPGSTIVIGNSLILRNTVNCTAGTGLSTIGPNRQYPGSDCGDQIASEDPGLDSSYAPGLISSARDGGDLQLCITEPTVGGVDLHGRTRIAADGTCALGAVERDLLDSMSAALTLGDYPGRTNCLVWLTVILMVLAFLTAFVWRLRKSSPSAHRVRGRS